MPEDQRLARARQQAHQALAQLHSAAATCRQAAAILPEIRPEVAETEEAPNPSEALAMALDILQEALAEALPGLERALRATPEELRRWFESR